MKDKIYLRNADLEDRQKKNRIFNPETGISEDGTMHDGVYRPWINQPKKERKMTIEEAINFVELNRIYYRDWKQDEFDKALARLKEPLTLADFLGLEEGQEYEYGLIKYKLENGRLMQYFDDPYRKGWTESRLSINNIGILKQAKKIEEPKLKAYHVKDRYSFDCLKKELGHFYVYGTENYIFEKIDSKGKIDHGWTNRINKIKDTHEIIEYHKEQPKLYAKIKGWELVEYRPHYWVKAYIRDRWYNELDKSINSNLDTAFPRHKEAYTKTEWAELGINEDNADFEEVE